MARVSAEALERWTHDLLAAAGLEREPAAAVAASLVEASLRGVDSHGVALLPVYLARIRGGGINRRPRPRVVSEDGAVAVVNGDDGPGQWQACSPPSCRRPWPSAMAWARSPSGAAVTTAPPLTT
jgi:LDH2 family malate/lactate/ureidoglycolate dehydrogenase